MQPNATQLDGTCIEHALEECAHDPNAFVPSLLPSTAPYESWRNNGAGCADNDTQFTEVMLAEDWGPQYDDGVSATVAELGGILSCRESRVHCQLEGLTALGLMSHSKASSFLTRIHAACPYTCGQCAPSHSTGKLHAPCTHALIRQHCAGPLCPRLVNLLSSAHQLNAPESVRRVWDRVLSKAAYEATINGDPFSDTQELKLTGYAIEGTYDTDHCASMLHNTAAQCQPISEGNTGAFLAYELDFGINYDPNPTSVMWLMITVCGAAVGTAQLVRALRHGMSSFVNQAVYGLHFNVKTVSSEDDGTIDGELPARHTFCSSNPLHLPLPCRSETTDMGN